MAVAEILRPEVLIKVVSKIGVHFLLVLTLWFLGHLLLSQLRKRWFAWDEESPLRAVERKKRADTLAGLAKTALNIFLALFLLVGVLSELGIDLKAILASAGIVGVAVGFGAQSLVKDVISGFFILLENQIRVGDAVVINGIAGVVESIHFRTVVLRDVEGTVHVIPNGAIATLANRTRDWSAYVMDVGISYKDDIDRAISIMRDVGAQMQQEGVWRDLILEPIEIFGVDAYADSAVMIKARLKTAPQKQWDVGREYRRRLKYRFDQEGIEFPFPQRSVTVIQSTGANVSS